MNCIYVTANKSKIKKTDTHAKQVFKSYFCTSIPFITIRFKKKKKKQIKLHYLLSWQMHWRKQNTKFY